jgi:hypothetical protein
MSRRRAGVFLAIGIAIAVVIAATPVAGHIGQNEAHVWRAHIKPKTDARYHPKAQANARFAQRGAKAVDADRLDGLDSTAFLRSDAKAADSELLDGLDSTGLLPATGKAADADLLDGIDSSGFVGSGGKAADAELLDGVDSTQFLRGTGQAIGTAVAIPAGQITGFFELRRPQQFLPFFSLQYVCPLQIHLNSFLEVRNFSNTVANFFWDSGGDSPGHRQLGGSELFTLGTQSFGDSFRMQIQWPFGVLRLKVALIHRQSTNDCHIQAQGVMTS